MGPTRGSRSSAKMWDSAAMAAKMDARFSYLELRVSVGDVFRGCLSKWIPTKQSKITILDNIRRTNLRGDSELSKLLYQWE
ncbi:caffeoyl-CoA O-methyltransferase [Musa troglodytarum]|uniref:Caffeoyl-CoA O-methyltransferase n=1 Tax=Musa troglodytarum TaxID=320322 RepID=A0A9E7H6B2_9LILI|nr:caffeoyl-CoA O-methyltransferase [Musa troglodytarum]